MIAGNDTVRVCLIDDDQVYTFGFKKLLHLKSFNNQVICFTNGYNAISWFRNPLNECNLPDVIFLDINMPNMDGWEFLQEFAQIKSQLGKNIPIYVLSSSIDLNDIYKAKNISDIEDYIFKPMNGHQLTEIINTVQEEADSKIYRYKSL